MVFNIVVILINFLLLAGIYIFLRRRIDKLTDTDKISSELAGELDTILAEINHVTDRNVLIIEDKIRELEEIIHKAEKRITLLKNSTALSDRKYVSKQAEPKQKQLIPDNDEKQSEGTGQGELTYSHLSKMSAMSGMVTPLKVSEKDEKSEKDIKQRVIELYKSGIDIALIASSIGINRGEAELIISLYRQTNG